MITSILWLSFLITLFPAFFSTFWIIVCKFTQKEIIKINVIIILNFLLICIIGIAILLLANKFNIYFNFHNINWTNMGLIYLLLILLPFAEILLIFVKNKDKKLKSYDFSSFLKISFVLIVGILEEIIYRLIQYNFFVTLIDNKIILELGYIFVSSIIFTLNHIEITKNKISLIFKFFLSLILSLSMIEFNNILLPIIGHCLYNLTMIIILKIGGDKICQ